MCVSTVPNKDASLELSSSTVKSQLGLTWIIIIMEAQLPPGPAEGKQGRKGIVGQRVGFSYTLSSLLPDLLQCSLGYTSLKSVHCKHAASAGHIQTGRCGVPAPVPWGLAGGGRAHVKQSVLEAGAVGVYVSVRSPSSAHSRKGNEEGKTSGRQSRESCLSSSLQWRRGNGTFPPSPGQGRAAGGTMCWTGPCSARSSASSEIPLVFPLLSLRTQLL